MRIRFDARETKGNRHSQKQVVTPPHSGAAKLGAKIYFIADSSFFYVVYHKCYFRRILCSCCMGPKSHSHETGPKINRSLGKYSKLLKNLVKTILFKSTVGCKNPFVDNNNNLLSNIHTKFSSNAFR